MSGTTNRSLQPTVSMRTEPEEMSKEIENMSYSQALTELESILSALRSDACDVDTLAERTRRAAQLLAHCRAKLTRTEEDLAKVLEELDGTLK